MTDTDNERRESWLMVPCAVGRDIGTDLPGWDHPCDGEAEAVVMIRGVLPDRDIPVSLCLRHRELLDALGMIEPKTP